MHHGLIERHDRAGHTLHHPYAAAARRLLRVKSMYSDSLGRTEGRDMEGDICRPEGVDVIL